MFRQMLRFPLSAVPRRGCCRRSRTPPARPLTFGEGVWLAALVGIALMALVSALVVPPGGGQDALIALTLFAGIGALVLVLYVALTPHEDNEPEPPMPVHHERIRGPNRQLPRDGRPPHRPYTGEFDLGDD